MIKMTDQWCIQVDITNVCVGHDCLYCSRYNRHIRNDQKYFMPLEQVDKVLNSLVGWPKTIGIIGGEPILHPQFIDICKQIQKIFPKEKMGLWTSGGHKYQEYLPTINETFGFVAFNEHSEHQKNTCKHQPLSLAISEVVEDELLVEKLVDNCWTQKNWCGTSNKFGSYFCEISAAIDLILFDGAHAWPTEGHWWDKSPEQYKEQREALCKFCGMALPVDRELIKNTKEKFTPKLLDMFRERNLKSTGEEFVEVFDIKLSKEEIKVNAEKWFPGNYRGDLVDDSSCGEGLGIAKETI